MKGIATLPIAILICAGAAAAQDQQAESLKRLPPDIKTYLDKKYPDWKFLPLSAQVVECRDAETKLHPSLVRGDFNGDGIPDFAVQIVHAGRVHAFEFLSQGRTFRVNPLFEGKQVPGKEFRASGLTPISGVPKKYVRRALTEGDRVTGIAGVTVVRKGHSYWFSSNPPNASAVVVKPQSRG